MIWPASARPFPQLAQLAQGHLNQLSRKIQPLAEQILNKRASSRDQTRLLRAQNDAQSPCRGDPQSSRAPPRLKIVEYRFTVSTQPDGVSQNLRLSSSEIPAGHFLREKDVRHDRHPLWKLHGNQNVVPAFAGKHLGFHRGRNGDLGGQFF